jgi:hypothetical protein
MFLEQPIVYVIGKRSKVFTAERAEQLTQRAAENTVVGKWAFFRFSAGIHSASLLARRSLAKEGV